MGRTVNYTYDTSGQHLMAVQGISGQTTQYTYSTGAGAAQEHGLLSIETPAHTHLFFTYDARGRLGSMARAGNTARDLYSYDSAGQVTITDALQNATKLFFNHQGLISAIEDALGRRTVLAFDDNLNLTRIIDPLGQFYEYNYDSHGNVIRSTSALGQVTAYSYTTDFNRLASVIDARGNSMNYAYDVRGNLTTITYADGSAEKFASDSHGEIDSWTNRRGQLVDCAVDAAGRFQRRDLPDGDFVEYRYNAARQTRASHRRVRHHANGVPRPAEPRSADKDHGARWPIPAIHLRERPTHSDGRSSRFHGQLSL